MIDFKQLTGIEQLAPLVGSTPARLRQFAESPARFYEEIRIAKKRKRGFRQFRLVYKADSALGSVHKAIADEIVAQTHFGDAVYAYREGYRAYMNAARHLHPKVLLHADLRSFFESITTERVKQEFALLGCTPTMAAFLAQLCTLDGSLPQGGRASPVLANRIGVPLDEELLKLAAACGATYTRYCDDLCFSGDAVPSEKSIRAAIERQGFRLRDGRCRIQKRGGAQYVTGFGVCEKDRPHLPRGLKRKLKQWIYCYAKFGFQNYKDKCNWPVRLSHIEGLLNYVVGHDRKLGEALRGQLEAAQQAVVQREAEADQS